MAEAKVKTTAKPASSSFEARVETPAFEFPKFGLTTMRERASSIRGALDIDSAPGSGTTIRFTMPLTATGTL